MRGDLAGYSMRFQKVVNTFQIFSRSGTTRSSVSGTGTRDPSGSYSERFISIWIQGCPLCQKCAFANKTTGKRIIDCHLPVKTELLFKNTCQGSNHIHRTGGNTSFSGPATPVSIISKTDLRAGPSRHPSDWQSRTGASNGSRRQS